MDWNINIDISNRKIVPLVDKKGFSPYPIRIKERKKMKFYLHSGGKATIRVEYYKTKIAKLHIANYNI